MPSLMELVDRVNRGETIDPTQLETYVESPNTAEKFLAHHSLGMLQLRQAHSHMLQSLEAIDFSDQKVLGQFLSISSFLGLNDQRANPVIKFGASCIARRDYGTGIEAIQTGISMDLAANGSYTRDQNNCLYVAGQYERAAAMLGFYAQQPISQSNVKIEIGYVASNLVDDEAQARFIRSLARTLDGSRFNLHVYVTDALVRRDKQQFVTTASASSSAKRGKETIDTLTRQRISVWTCPTDSDCVNAAKDLGNQLTADKIDIIFFDTSLNDSIASLVSNWEIARAKVNIARRLPMYSSSLSSVVYFDQSRCEADRALWTRQNIDSRFVIDGIDLGESLGPTPQRATYGIPTSAVVLATAGNELDRTLSGEFVDTVTDILRAHPHAVYLIIGEGELTWQKRRFESAGVARRIGYAGRRKDLPGFLRIADIYLAEFPIASPAGVLGAMSMEKPVVAARWGDSVETSQASALVGSEYAINAADPAQYVERVSRLTRDMGYRIKLGRALRQRVEAHYSFDQTARQVEQLCEQLLNVRTGSGMNVTPPAPVSAVA